MAAVAGLVTSSDLISRIGNTPLLPLRLASHPGVAVLGKAEFLNPGGSVKDRPALNMVLRGEAQGLLHSGKILLDSTSGNTGIAYAMICAARGYRVRLCLPENASPERKQILRAYGADLILTSPSGGSDGAMRVCREMFDATPQDYFYPNQYDNPANWQAHFDTTGPEILEQTDGQVTHFVAALGTTGTFMGVSRRLRGVVPSVRCIAVQPSTPLHGLEGVKHMPTAVRPAIFDPAAVDETIEIDTEDAYAMARRLAREEGILVGVSAAANVLAAVRLADRLRNQGEQATVVTILCDGGQKYLSEPFWND